MSFFACPDSQLSPARIHASFNNSFRAERFRDDDVTSPGKDETSSMYYTCSHKLYDWVVWLVWSQGGKHGPEEPVEFYHHISVRHPRCALCANLKQLAKAMPKNHLHINETSTFSRGAPYGLQDDDLRMSLFNLSLTECCQTP